MAQLKIKLVKSLIGSKKDQIATAQSLGLRKIGDETTQPRVRWQKSSTSSTLQKRKKEVRHNEFA